MNCRHKAVGSEHMAWDMDCPGAFLRASYSEMIDFIFNDCGFTDSEIKNFISETAKYIYKISD